MKRIPKTVCSLAVGGFMSTSVSAHNPPPQEEYLVPLGTGEALELVLLANCNGPENDDDASIVPVAQRSITVNVVGEGRNFGSTAFAWSFLDIGISNGEATKVELPAHTYGELLNFRIEYVSGQGPCRLNVVGRQTSASGETVGNPILSGYDISLGVKI